MRLPVTCYDVRLLEDEPFLTEFLVCANIQVGRQGAEQRQLLLSMVATQYLKEVPDGTGVRVFFPVSYIFLNVRYSDLCSC